MHLAQRLADRLGEHGCDHLAKGCGEHLPWQGRDVALRMASGVSVSLLGGASTCCRRTGMPEPVRKLAKVSEKLLQSAEQGVAQSASQWTAERAAVGLTVVEQAVGGRREHAALLLHDPTAQLCSCLTEACVYSAALARLQEVLDHI